MLRLVSDSSFVCGHSPKFLGPNTLPVLGCVRLVPAFGVKTRRQARGDRALPPCSGHGICGYAASGSVAGVRFLS